MLSDEQRARMLRHLAGDVPEHCYAPLGRKREEENTMTDQREADCVFCDKVDEGSVTWEALQVYSFEPLNPVTPGHRLFIAREHHAFPHDHPRLAGLALSAAARYAGEQGGAYNLIVNAGDAASQTIPHVHIHYVPREAGDGLKLPWTDQHGHQS